VDQHADHGRNCVPVLLRLRRLGALASETYPSGRTIANALFDAAGRVTEVTGSTGTNYVQSVTYVPQGVSTLTLGNNLTETWTYGTEQKQPTALAAGSALALTWGYGPDSTNNGNILSETISAVPPAGAVVNASQAFSYDKVNRLTGSSEGGSWTRNYSYDQYGNGWVTANSGVPLSPSTPQNASNYNAQNQLLINSAAYDAAGNQTAIAGYVNTMTRRTGC